MPASKSAASDSKLAGWMRGANASQQGVEKSLAEFYAHCEAGRWVEADQARERAIAHVESHCDNMVAVYRALSET